MPHLICDGILLCIPNFMVSWLRQHSLYDGQLGTHSNLGDHGQSFNLYRPSSKLLYNRKKSYALQNSKGLNCDSPRGLVRSSICYSFLLQTLQASSGRCGSKGKATCVLLWTLYRIGNYFINESEQHTQMYYTFCLQNSEMLTYKAVCPFTLEGTSHMIESLDT